MSVDYAGAALMFLRAAGLFSLWLIGERDSRGWKLGGVVQVAMIAWALATGSYALIPLSALGIVVYIMGHWAWNRPQGKPYVVRLESELEEAVEKYADLVRRSEARIERDGQTRHDRATYTRRLNTYAHELRDAAIAGGVTCPPVPEPPKEDL